jgi:hypothetical protein
VQGRVRSHVCVIDALAVQRTNYTNSMFSQSTMVPVPVSMSRVSMFRVSMFRVSMFRETEGRIV